MKNEDKPYIDLRDNRQILLLNHYIFGIDPDTLFPAKAYFVERDQGKGTTVRTPLEVKNCQQMKKDYSDLNLKFEAN